MEYKAKRRGRLNPPFFFLQSKTDFCDADVITIQRILNFQDIILDQSSTVSIKIGAV